MGDGEGSSQAVNVDWATIVFALVMCMVVTWGILESQHKHAYEDAREDSSVMSQHHDGDEDGQQLEITGETHRRSFSFPTTAHPPPRKKKQISKSTPPAPAAVTAEVTAVTGPVTGSGASSPLVVDKEGGGNYKTVQAAIDAAPAGKAGARAIIIIKKGTYKEKVDIPSTKPFITILAEEGAKVTYNKGADDFQNLASDESGTALAATFTVLASDTIISGLTFQNSYGYGTQAPALRAVADRVAFYNCTFLGHQDTLFAHRGRQYYKNCSITGSVDFVFGNARALFEDCTYTAINSDDFMTAYISAHYRQSLTEKTGFVFLRGTIKSELEFPWMPPFFGRLWGPYNTAIFAYVNLDTEIHPGGWVQMKGMPKSYSKTAMVYELENVGKGASSKRVKWAHTTMTSEEKDMYLGPQWIDASKWVVAP